MAKSKLILAARDEVVCLNLTDHYLLNHTHSIKKAVKLNSFYSLRKKTIGGYVYDIKITSSIKFTVFLKEKFERSKSNSISLFCPVNVTIFYMKSSITIQEIFDMNYFNFDKKSSIDGLKDYLVSLWKKNAHTNPYSFSTNYIDLPLSVLEYTMNVLFLIVSTKKSFVYDYYPYHINDL